MHIHVCIFPQVPLPSRLSHNIEQSSLCYAVGLRWLSVSDAAVCCCCRLVAKSCLTLFLPHGTVAHQAPLSMEFSRQEYWSGLPFPSPGHLPGSEIQPALAGRFFTTEPPMKHIIVCTRSLKVILD